MGSVRVSLKEWMERCGERVPVQMGGVENIR